MLNEKLADVRGISPDSREKIIKLQDYRIRLMNVMAQSMDADDKMKAELLADFRRVEKELQALWKFDFSAHNAFMAELKISGCNCPYLDNKDGKGLRRFINKSCKWHK